MRASGIYEYSSFFGRIISDRGSTGRTSDEKTTRCPVFVLHNNFRLHLRQYVGHGIIDWVNPFRTALPF